MAGRTLSITCENCGKVKTIRYEDISVNGYNNDSMIISAINKAGWIFRKTDAFKVFCSKKCQYYYNENYSNTTIPDKTLESFDDLDFDDENLDDDDFNPDDILP